MSTSKSGGAVGPFHSVAEAVGCVQTTDWMLLVLLFFAVLGGYHVHFMLTAGDWDFWVDWKDRRMWPTVVPILGVTFCAAAQAFFWVNFRLPFGATFAVLGLLIVAISMTGLANALTMSVLERTREIGILRSIGARARDIRRIFSAETLALALTGWLIGVPVGYLLDRLLVWLVQHVVEVDVPFAFPLTYVAIALVGTVLLAQLITLLPIRRAVRYRPGNALRYA